MLYETSSRVKFLFIYEGQKYQLPAIKDFGTFHTCFSTQLCASMTTGHIFGDFRAIERFHQNYPRFTGRQPDWHLAVPKTLPGPNLLT